MTKRFLQEFRQENFTDDFERISDCDWIIEVVIERLDITTDFRKSRSISKIRFSCDIQYVRNTNIQIS